MKYLHSITLTMQLLAQYDNVDLLLDALKEIDFDTYSIDGISKTLEKFTSGEVERTGFFKGPVEVGDIDAYGSVHAGFVVKHLEDAHYIEPLVGRFNDFCDHFLKLRDLHALYLTLHNNQRAIFDDTNKPFVDAACSLLDIENPFSY